MLRALEEDKFNQLPGGIFNKGFVRAYSRCVGLDEDQTVAEYLLASGDAPPPKTEIGGHEDGERKNEARENEQNIRRLEAISDTPARQLPWGLFAALLLVVALALSFWSHRERERARQSIRPTPTAAPAPSPGVGGGVASAGASGGANPDNGARSPTAGSPTNGSPANASPTGESAPSVSPKTPPDLTAVRRNSGRVYSRHSCPRRLLGLDHRRRQNFLVRTFGRRQRALDPRPEGNQRPGGKLRWHRLSLQRKEGRHWGNVRRGQERYFWPWRNVSECPIAAYEALTLSLFFLPFTVHLPPSNADSVQLNVSSLRLCQFDCA